MAGTTTYTYNTNDRLLTETTSGVTTTYTYDHNGNTQTETQGNNQTLYTWNSNNQLTGATVTQNGQTQQLSYRYDINGVRVASIVDGVETRYLIDENRPYAQVLEEYAPNGTAQARYVYGGDLDLISQTRGSTESIYLRDGHSGVRQLTNATGAVTDTYTYDAYGNLLRSTGTTQNSYQYRGEQSDSNLGMQYLRARYYDQNTGRFASVDPFEGWQEQPMSRHRYMYGYNNPITYSDPSGLFALASPSQLTGLLGVYMTVLGTLGTLATAQAAGSRILRQLRGDITWSAKLEGISASIQLAIGSGVRGAVLSAKSDQLSSPIGVDQERFFSGKWLQLSTGLDLGNYGGLGKGEVINTPLFQLTSPAVWGAHPGTLSGATTFIGSTSGFGTITLAVIGLGSGTIRSFKGTDVDAGVSIYSGISIPIYGEELPA